MNVFLKAAVVLFLVFASWVEGRAAEINQQQATLIYAMAHSVSGIPLADKAPRIELVSPEKVQEVMDNKNAHVRYAGAYISETDTIYLDDTLDFSNPYDASVLLHEAVHYLQVHAHGVPTTCEAWAQNEIQAYGVQIAVLEKAGLDPRPMMMSGAQYLSVCYRQKTAGKMGAGMPQADIEKLGKDLAELAAEVDRVTIAASSQGLVEPFTSMERLCAFRVQIMSTALPYKQQMTVDELLNQQPFPDSWSDGMKDLGRKDITELFDFVGEGRVFIQQRYQACMQK